MVTCCRRKVKSILGCVREVGGASGLTVAGVGATVEAAVVTSLSAGTSRLWPTALSLVEGRGPGSVGVAVSAELAGAGCSHGKCWSLKGRLVFQTAKTRW